MSRSYSQIPSRLKYLKTVIATTWLYPMEYVKAALAITTLPYTFDGTNIVCPDISGIISLYSEIFDQTAIAQSTGNTGFSLGVGTMLEDMGGELFFRLPNGNMVIHWRNVRQLTPQVAGNIPVPGDSPPDTIGFVTVAASYGNILPSTVFELPVVVRTG